MKSQANKKGWKVACLSCLRLTFCLLQVKGECVHAPVCQREAGNEHFVLAS